MKKIDETKIRIIDLGKAIYFFIFLLFSFPLRCTPYLVSQLSIFNSPMDLEAVNSDIWVANSTGTLQKVNIGINGELSLVQSVDVPSLTDISIDSGILVGCAGSLIYIVDISLPHSPVLLNSYQINASVSKVIIRYPYVFLKTSVSFDLLNIANPQTIVHMGSLLCGVQIDSFCFVDNLMIVSFPDSTVHIYNVINPLSPEELNCINIHARCLDIISQTNHAYLACGLAGLRIVDFSDINNLVYQTNIQTDHQPTKVSILGNILVTSCQGWLLDYYHITPNTQPNYQSTFMTWTNTCLLLTDNYTITGGGTNLYSIDHTELTDPFLLWEYNTAGSTRKLFYNDNLLWVINFGSGVQCYQLNGNSPPSLVSSIAVPGASDLCIRDTLLFLADNSSGLRVYSINMISQPILMGVCSTGGGVWRIALHNNVIFGIRSSIGLRIFEISNPRYPQLINTYPLAGAQNIIIEGNLAYITSSGTTLTILNIINPLQIQFVSDITLQGLAGGITKLANFLYINNGNGILVLDVAQPNFILLVDYLQPEPIGFAMDTSPLISNNLLICWNNITNKIYVFRCDNPAHPILEQTIAWNRHTRSAIAQPSGLITANEELGFCYRFFTFTSTENQPIQTNSHIINVYPNPTNKDQSFSFYLDNSLHYHIVVYNIKGKKLCNFSGSGIMGKVKIDWDGKDSRGVSLPSGIYMLKAYIGNKITIKKLLRY